MHGKLGDALFPWKPKSVEAFIAGLFWHSMAMTATTPLERMRKQWQGILTLPWLLNRVGVRSPSGQEWEEAYLVYPEEAAAPGIDKTFGLHAFFGMLWIIAAYVQMVHVKRWGGASLHRKSGYITALAFLAHMTFSVNILCQDIMKNSMMVKVMLASVVTISSTYFFQAMKFAVAKRIQLHTDCMVRCFLYSIEGAGTIRTVGWIMWLGGYGPTFCQAQHGAMNTQCFWPYVSRLLWIRVLTVYWLGCYARLRGDPVFTRMYMTEVKLTAVVSLVGLLAAWIAPPEDIIELILSKGPMSCSFVILALYSAVAVYFLVTPKVPLIAGVGPQDRRRSRPAEKSEAPATLVFGAEELPAGMSYSGACGGA